MAGGGIEGLIGGSKVVGGGIRFGKSNLPAQNALAAKRASISGAVVVAIGINGRMAGEIVLADESKTGVQRNGKLQTWT